MSTVIIPGRSRRSSPEQEVGAPPVGAASRAWRILGWLGLAYFLMSVVDIALGWIPVKFGTPEWEFGTFSATFAGLAIPTLSLFLMLGSAVAREKTTATRTIGWILVVFAVGLGIVGLLYLTSVPLALKAVASNELISLGLKKSVVKSLMLFLGYEILYVLGAWQGLRRTALA
jgi:hypothetical protein